MCMVAPIILKIATTDIVAFSVYFVITVCHPCTIVVNWALLQVGKEGAISRLAPVSLHERQRWWSGFGPDLWCCPAYNQLRTLRHHSPL